MRRIFVFLGVIAFAGVGAAFVPHSDEGPATVIRDNFCLIADAEGGLWIDFDCRAQQVINKNRYSFSVTAQLPDIAPRPERAVRFSVYDLGFGGCFELGDRGDFVVTPSGRVNITCRSAE